MNTRCIPGSLPVILIVMLATGIARAAVPSALDYQAYLANPDGSPINDSILITFAIYEAPAGGVPLWSETQFVTVDQGLFSVRLGDSLPLPAGVADAPRYIGITVDADLEMVPRRQVAASMFALAAEDAVQLGGAPPSAYDQSAHVTDTGNPHNVTAAQTGAAADLAAHTAVPSAHHSRYTSAEAVSAVLASDGPGSGLNADLLDNLSSTQFVQQGQPNSINAAMIQSSAVAASEIAVNAVGSSEIAANAVGSSEIATGAVASAEILNGTITGTDINFSGGFNHTGSDLNGGLWSITNSTDGLPGNYPVGLLGQASGNPGSNRVIGVAGLAPGLGAGAPVTALPSGLKYGVVGIVDAGTGVAAITNNGLGIYADGTVAASKGVGINGPTLGYAGVQGTSGFDGTSGLNISGFEIGLLGVSNGGSISDNYGVYGFSNNVGVFGSSARLAGEFVGAVKVSKDGETMLTGNRIVVSSKTAEQSIVIDADAGPVGQIKAGEFVVTGGADFAENFDVGTGSAVQPGTVLSIDPAESGSLMVSAEAYDRKVAGIVSGAGGVRSGVIMSQDGSIADGEYPVALTGRVYVRADASAGAIRPGDLLTTSSRVGHAMRAADHARASGAIIGKAMTSLDEGTGLVLVLVSLQ